MISVARPSSLGAMLAIISTVAALTLGTAGTALAAATCSGVAEHPFVPWIDPAAYTLAPGATFEVSITAWKLADCAKLSAGNEPFKVHKSTDGRSLSLPAGGSATSPAQCVDLLSPTLRFFAAGGNGTSPRGRRDL